ncbi:hypothetical protein HMPREF0602_0747, partial [Neisseria meningitidis ATCC 13091]
AKAGIRKRKAAGICRKKQKPFRTPEMFQTGHLGADKKPIRYFFIVFNKFPLSK